MKKATWELPKDYIVKAGFCIDNKIYIIGYKSDKDKIARRLEVFIFEGKRKFPVQFLELPL